MLTRVKLDLVFLDRHGGGLVDVHHVVLVGDEVVLELVDAVAEGSLLLLTLFCLLHELVVGFGELLELAVTVSDFEFLVFQCFF